MLNRPLFQFSALFLALQASSTLYAEDAIRQLDDLVLQANSEDPFEKSQQQLNGIAGATNLIDVRQTSQRIQTNADILKGEAGIYTQSAGNEGVKISIRGSGINRGSGAHASGHYVLLDNIPLTGPGGTPYELLEPNWLSHVEVLRGSNGLEKGALALGGAINYVSQNGKNQSGAELKLATGHHGYQKYHLSYGQDLGALDYYIAATHSQSNGYQQHSQSEATGVSANIGYQVNDQVNTRFYLRYRQTEHQTPGRLTQQQIHDQPEQANPYNLAINAHRVQPGSTWLAHQTTWTSAEGGTLQASLAYHDYPMDLQESLYRIYVDYTDLTGKLTWTQPSTWLNRDNIFKASLTTTTQHNSANGSESLRFDNDYAEAGTISRHYVHRGHDQILNLHNELEWSPGLWWVTGLGVTYSQRDAYVTWPAVEDKLQQNTWDYIYRLGLRYELNDDTQLYANVSRSVEPAHAWSMLWGSNHYFPTGSGAATGRQNAAVPLSNQHATSFEVGGHGQSILGAWSASYYRAALKDELLMVELQAIPNQIIAESNASDTIHQGVELGLKSKLWQAPDGADLSLKQAYTFSDFYYKNDAKFKRNELAGIPRHYYQAQLQYQHPQGWFVGLNTEYAAKMPIDYANTRYTDAYQIWGVNAGWNAIRPDLDLWLDAKNLSNERYSSTITPGFDDLGEDRARATPGEGRALYAGINYRF